jgi:dihydrofolate reductase
MSIKLIAAVDELFGIGFNNDLLIKSSVDMKHFKELTSNGIVIYGRKTFESLPNQKPLPNRINVMLTRNSEYEVPANVIKMKSVENILNHYNSGKQDKDIWAIGGSEVYQQFFPYVEEAHITIFHKQMEFVDKWFPHEYLHEHFTIEDREYYEDEKCNVNMHFVKYVRI